MTENERSAGMSRALDRVHDGSADAAKVFRGAFDLLDAARTACGRAVDALSEAHDVLEVVRW